MPYKPLMLIVLDGWGWREDPTDNAVAQARTPVWDRLLQKYPHTLLEACGRAVGLPAGVMGNSEVGHMNIGAGRVVYQDLSLIDVAIEDGSFFKNPVLKETFSKILKSGGALHLMGLLSDAGVHSHINHLFALLDAAKAVGLAKIWVHCFMDGRDSPPNAGEKYLERLETKLKEIPGAKIGTIIGRYYAMDRDKRWERTERAINALTKGEGNSFASAQRAIQSSYSKGITDEFVEPAVLGGKIADGDGVIFFNFRADRTRQLTRKLAMEPDSPKLSTYVTMTQYENDFTFPVLFPPKKLENVLGEVLSQNGLKQFRIAETEKYAHVTYFLNGGREVEFKGEDRALVPSPRDVPTYDKKPEMSAEAVTDEVLRRIESKKYDVLILNFANADMVGHSGNMEATIKACETVDLELARILKALHAAGGTALITADHGNAEQLKDANGNPHTSHTLNLVPFLIVPPAPEKFQFRSGGKLCDIAPTMLKLLDIPQPKEMTGKSLY